MNAVVEFVANVLPFLVILFDSGYYHDYNIVHALSAKS